MSDNSTSRFDISRSTERCWDMLSFGFDELSGSFLRREGRKTTKTMVNAPIAYTAHCIVSVAASKRIIHEPRSAYSTVQMYICHIPRPIVLDPRPHRGQSRDSGTTASGPHQPPSAHGT